MNELRFGSAGIPLSTLPRNILNGIKESSKLGLKAMEMEFVQSVFVSKELAPQVKEKAQQEDVVLTAHGSYFINLNAKEPEKLGASRSRIIQAAKRTFECGGYSVTFHPAFYLKDPPAQVHAQVKKELGKVIQELKDEGVKIWVRPETTGKPTQYGSLDELLTLSQELDMVMPCIDWAHLHARSNGKFNSTAEWNTVLEKVEKTLGKEGLHNMHCHVSGINYGEKGEKNHLILTESDLKWKELVEVWKEWKIKGVIVCESPNLETDALLLQKNFLKK